MTMPSGATPAKGSNRTLIIILVILGACVLLSICLACVAVFLLPTIMSSSSFPTP